MKKLLVAGTALIMVILFCLLVPGMLSGASADDFHIEGTTLVDYTGTAANVSIPNTVEVIGRSAFENNSTVKKITIPSSVKTIEEYAFWGCQKLESVTLEKGVKEVSDFAFSACEHLREVRLPDTIQRIGIMAFADCISLTDIYIPSSVTDIHSTAFDGVYFIDIRAEQFSYPYRYALERGSNIANVPQHLLVTPIPTNTTPQTTPTSSTVAPTVAPVPTVTPVPGTELGSTIVVGNQAVVFIDNTDMDVLKGNQGLGNANTQNTPQPKESIKEWAYYGVDTLTQIQLGTNINAIEKFAFSRTKLTSICIPDGVERIDYAAFYYCEDLETVEIPQSVTYIGEKAFAGTPWLESFYDGSMVLAENSDFLIVGDGVLIAYRGQEKDPKLPSQVKYVAPDVF